MYPWTRQGVWGSAAAPNERTNFGRRTLRVAFDHSIPAAGLSSTGLQSAGQGSTPSALEPQLPRKKKHPEVAYRNHQVLHYDYPGGESSDSLDSTASGAGAQHHPPADDSATAADILRARSEERGNSKNQTSSQRSRSADPSLGGRAKAGDVLTQEEVNAAKMTEYQLSFARRKMDSNLVGIAEEGQRPTVSKKRGQSHQRAAGRPSGAVNKTSEYRSAFGWPAAARTAFLLQASTGRGGLHQERGGGVDIITGALGHSGGEPASSARKSYSMGTIANIGTKEEDAANEDGEETPKRRTKGVTEYKAKFKPFSSYLYIDGNWRKPATKARVENNNVENGDDDVKGITDPEHAWYTEVVERIKKADEYRWRAHGTPIYGGEVVKEAYGPGAITRQAELWSQVHDRTSLLALSLATTPKHPARGDEKTPDKQRAHKSPISGPALAAIHKREIRPVSVERKKSPAAEKKRSPAPTTSSSEAARKTASAGSRPARHSSVAPPSIANRGSKREDTEGKTGRATSADPTTRRVAPPSTLLRTTAASEGKRVTLDSTSTTDGAASGKKPTSASKTAVAAHARSKSKAAPSKEQQQGTPVARPRPVVRPSAPDTSAAATVNGDSDGKIWLKPASKDEEDGGGKATDDTTAAPPEVDGDKQAEELAPMTNGALSPEMEAESSLSSAGPGERRDVSRPCSLPAVNGGQEGQVNGQQYSSPSPLPEPHIGPVPLTTVKSPEELTGVKSPDPESWTVSLETNRGLEWTDGHTPEPNRVKSPPLTTTPFKVASNQPLSPQSSYEQVPTKPIKAFHVDEVIGGLPASPDIDGTEAIPIGGSGGELESGDVLDRARNRLDQFWSKSK